MAREITIRPLILSTYDGKAGAARGAYRLHLSLRHIGVDSRMLVQGKFTDDKTVLAPKGQNYRAIRAIRRWLDNLPNYKYPHRKHNLSVQWLPNNVLQRVKRINPDIIHLQWIRGAFLPIETLRHFNKPIVWTLRDMWAFTGGCPYSQSCTRYTIACGACPLLRSTNPQDLSHHIWRRKQNAWQNLNLTVVGVSSWLAACARQSSLFSRCRIESIPNALNLTRFHPVDQDYSRGVLNLPLGKKQVLFGALDAVTDPRKGYSYLLEALKRLSGDDQWRNRIELVIFGAEETDMPPGINFPVHFLGVLRGEEALSHAYSAADVMVVPSVQEAFGQTASESLACGTPVVAFDSTGPRDIVDHQQNGYLAQSFDPVDLAQGISWVLEDESRLRILRHNARRKAEAAFSQKHVALKYLKLYESILVNQ